MSRTFAVLDLKCKDISGVAARWARNGAYFLEGFTMSRSRGIHRGVITDIASATDSISHILGKLKKKTGKKIQDVYVSASSNSLKIVQSRGTVLLSKYGREIFQSDIEKCVRIGSILKLPHGRAPLHKMVKDFSVDGENGIKNPAGLEGVKLGVDMNVLVVDSSVIRNLTKSIALAGFSASGVIFSGIAYAKRALAEAATDKGVMLLNMCKDLTEAMIYHKRNLLDCKVFRLGSEDIISANGSLDHASANRLILVLRSMAGWDKVREIVITGDAAQNEGILEPMQTLSSHPVRFGFCLVRPYEELPAERAAHIGSLGMLDYLYETKKGRRMEGNLFKQTFSKTLSFLDKYF